MSDISIIIPVYNAEKYIERCLNSLINQTFSNIEILCINDGSTDNSLNILEEYSSKDSRIKVFSQNNSGPAQARNIGLKNARATYLMFCDSDDWYEPNMCEVMYKTISSKNVDCVMCGCNITYDYFDENRIISDEFYNPQKERIIKKNMYLQNVLLWNKIFKKSIIDKYDIKFPNGYKHDDDCFWYKYSIICKNMVLIVDKLYNYVVRKNSIMDNYYQGKQESYLDRLFITKDVISFAEKNNIVKKKRKELLYVLKNQMESLSNFVQITQIQDQIKNLCKILDCEMFITEKTISFFDRNKFYLYYKYYRYVLLSKFVSEKKRKKYEQKIIDLRAKINLLQNIM